MLVPLLEDPLAAGDAIAALRRYSLISPPADGSVSVHRLVQAVTADHMPAELASQWRLAAAALIEAAIPADTEPARDLGGMRRAAAARPGGPCPMTAMGWRGLPITSDERQLRRRPGSPAESGWGEGTSPRPGAPAHPDHPARARPLHRGGGGPGRRP